MQVFWSKQARILRTSYINLAIVIINVLVFFYCINADRSYIFAKYGGDSLAIFGGEYYRLITATFLHVDAEHVLSNMMILLFVGANVEHDIGHLSYTVVYFLSGIVASLCSAYHYLCSGTADAAISIGASGAVFGVTGAVIIIALFGRKHLSKDSTFIKRLLFVVAIQVYNGFVEKGIDNAAHIGGLICGLVITLFITLILKKEYTMEEWL